jgi:UDP-N-acetylmuramoyl-tripeptide--D-alanyl-D-alanine ligase
MLQVCEYNPRDYLNWLARTSDFASVEKRGRLRHTAKASLIQLIIAVMLLAGYVASLSLIWLMHAPIGLAVAIVCLAVTPYVVAYAVLVPLFIARFTVQYPLERFTMRKARARLAASSAQIIAVAGSFGKTSMRDILRTVLSEGKTVAAPPESYNTPLGISRFVQGLSGHEEVLVFELGEYYPGDVRRLSNLVQPDIGVITGVNEAHLSKFKTIDRTVGTIFELADWLGDKLVFVNGDNQLASEAARTGHVLYSREGSGPWRVGHASTGLGGTTFDLANGGLKIHVRTHLLGLHQVGPLAAAADLAFRLGMSPRQIETGLSKVKPFAHRLEPKVDSDGVTILDDSYNGNPDGVAAVISFLGTLTGHRRIYVTPGLVEMGHQSRQVHEHIGRLLAEAGIETIVLIRNSATPHIARGLGQAKYSGEVLWFDDGPSSVAAIPHMTTRGDVVLLQNDWPDQYA